MNNILSPCIEIHFTNTVEYQWNKCYFNGTNCTNGQVECTPTQPEANKNIRSPHNEMHLTSGINAIPLVPIVPIVPMDK